ncbi:MAG: T9SS type A sorting domain-containing protein [Bacteroidota bacterium]
MKSIIFLFIGLLALGSLKAQACLGMYQVGSIAGEITDANGTSLTQSIGAVAATVIKDNDVRLDQGMFLACDLSCDCLLTDIESTLYENPMLSLFPNPTSGLLKTQGESAYIHSYQLFSPTGQLLRSGIIHQQQISLQQFPTGLYLLHVFGRDGQIRLVSKVMKR